VTSGRMLTRLVEGLRGRQATKVGFYNILLMERGY